MKKLMLINASHDEESRVALVVDNYLQELDIESAQKSLTKGNIYKATITKVEPSLQAAFVEYGAARQAFLPLNEIHPDYWKDGVDKSSDPRKISIQDVVESRQTLLIQVVKEERGNKGAAVTTFLSLAGRYLVLMPNTDRGGISRKLSDSERKTIKDIIVQLDVPEKTGVIVRTAGRDQPLEALQWDFQYLQRIWEEIRVKGESAPSPALIYLEGDIATRAIRDHFTDDIDEIWVDDLELFNRTQNFVHAVLPGKEKLVKHYRNQKSMFRHFNVESQCEDIHEREIRLPSGGSIVFDPTEALTAIDINSSRATGGKNIDETALATNLEAAAEIARQLRIRDIGGLVVIDFIDMANRKHAQEVETVLRDATKPDKARIQITRISRFGLLEMSRQRLHPSVRESTTEVCPRCRGKGMVRTTESMALQMLTRMEDWAEAGKKPTLIVQVPSDTGEYLMNRKRDSIAQIEESYGIQITLQIRPEFDIPHYRVERQWLDQQQLRTEILEDTLRNKRPTRPTRKLKPMKPVVGIPKIQHPPVKKVKVAVAKEEKQGFIARILGALFGANTKKVEQEVTAKATETVVVEAVPERPANRTRSRNRNRNRNRKPDDAAPEAVVDANVQLPEAKTQLAEPSVEKNNGAEKRPEGEKRRRPKRRKPRATVATDAEPTAPVADAPVVESNANNAAGVEAAVQSGEDEQPKRRRRRRRRRPANPNQQGDQGATTPDDSPAEQSAAAPRDTANTQSGQPVNVEPRTAPQAVKVVAPAVDA